MAPYLVYQQHRLIHIMNTIAAECITHQELTATTIVVECAIIMNTILLWFTHLMNYITYQNNQNSMPKVYNQKQYFTKY